MLKRAPRAWEQAVDHLIAYLPRPISHWVIVHESPLHDRTVDAVRSRLDSSETIVLGHTGPEKAEALARGYAERDDVGFLGFHQRRAQPYQQFPEYAGAMEQFARWRVPRIKLLVDVWDDNFPDLFAEDPHAVLQRCGELKETLLGREQFTYRTAPAAGPAGPATSAASAGPLRFDCAGSEWVAYSGLEEDDYVLPSGEVACLPRSVDGELDVTGWVIGTIPFGHKYGAVHPGELSLSFAQGQVVEVKGDRTPLCRDVEEALTRLPGLRQVGELGIGQSRAVIEAARDHEVAYHWTERHFGIHIGLGAELPETTSEGERTTNHHLDLILSTGTLDGDGTHILTW